MKRFHLISLGCPKNRVDSEEVMGLMFDAGFTHSDNPNDSHVIIINTCAFIGPAAQESVDTILDHAHYNKEAVLIVTGCLNRRYPEDLKELLPEVDHFVDPSDIVRIPGLALADLDGKSQQGRCGKGILGPSCSRTQRRRIITTPGYAYLKIADGCSRACSYCTIPSIRGPFRSRHMEELAREAASLVKNSAKELVLVAQDITLYGKEMKDGASLVSLLNQLEGVEGLEWIRLMYLNPHGVSDDLIEFVRESRITLPYLDIPFQHVSDKVLKSMGRPCRASEIKELVKRLRKEIPGLVLRTTVMVGYPTEGDSEFQELFDFVREFRIDRVGIFQYCAEEGTRAYGLGDPVPPEIKRARADELARVQAEIDDEKNRARIGEITRALIEGVSDESELLLQGRTWDQAPEVDGVLYINEGIGRAGAIQDVEIVDSHGQDLFGRIIEPPSSELRA